MYLASRITFDMRDRQNPNVMNSIDFSLWLKIGYVQISHLSHIQRNFDLQTFQIVVAPSIPEIGKIYT